MSCCILFVPVCFCLLLACVFVTSCTDSTFGTNTLFISHSKHLLNCHIAAWTRFPERLRSDPKGPGLGILNEVRSWTQHLYRSREVMDSSAIGLHCQFEDDIVFSVAHDRQLTKHYVWGMVRRRKQYKLRCEDTSVSQAKFLELRVSRMGSRIVTAPEFCATGRQTLGSDSAHAPNTPHCHTSSSPSRITMSRALTRNTNMFMKAITNGSEH